VVASSKAVEQGGSLLLAPSLGRGAEDFAEVAGLLREQDFHVISPEPFGLAASENLEAADLEVLARHLLAAAPEDGKIIVIGHAFGNWVARMAAVLAPERVCGVVLLAAARRVIPTEIKSSIDGSFKAALTDEERLAHLRRAYFAPGNDARVWLHGWHPDMAAGQRRAAARSDRAIWWHAGGTVPILDVQAADDAIAPASAASELRDELGGRVTTVTIKNAGHALLPEQPQAVVRAIVDFVRRLDAEGNFK
jgi:pimeloyl-ACP methyl ester carboxylesterase